VVTIYTCYNRIYTVPGIMARHTGRDVGPTSLGLYVMHAQATQSVRPVESTGRLAGNFRNIMRFDMPHALR